MLCIYIYIKVCAFLFLFVHKYAYCGVHLVLSLMTCHAAVFEKEPEGKPVMNQSSTRRNQSQVAAFLLQTPAMATGPVNATCGLKTAIPMKFSCILQPKRNHASAAPPQKMQQKLQ